MNYLKYMYEIRKEKTETENKKEKRSSVFRQWRQNIRPLLLMMT